MVTGWPSPWWPLLARVLFTVWPISQCRAWARPRSSCGSQQRVLQSPAPSVLWQLLKMQPNSMEYSAGGNRAWKRQCPWHFRTVSKEEWEEGGEGQGEEAFLNNVNLKNNLSPVYPSWGFETMTYTFPRLFSVKIEWGVSLFCTGFLPFTLRDTLRFNEFIFVLCLHYSIYTCGMYTTQIWARK